MHARHDRRPVVEFVPQGGEFVRKAVQFLNCVSLAFRPVAGTATGDGAVQAGGDSTLSGLGFACERVLDANDAYVPDVPFPVLEASPSSAGPPVPLIG
jgi:hypothetical protein